MKKGHIRKGLVIGIAAAALMATAAGAVNAATDGQLLERARIFLIGEWSYHEDGSKTIDGIDEDGNKVHFSVKDAGQRANEGAFYTTTTEGEDGALVTTVQMDEEQPPVVYEDGSTSTKAAAVTITEQ